MDFSSKLLNAAVDEIGHLPGIGKRTAIRLALYLLRQPESQTKSLTKSLLDLREQIGFCKQCHNISDNETCEICNNKNRDKTLVCVVEDIRDVMAIENTQQYRGIYHVLGGKISPVEGVGPQNLNINSLIEKAKSNAIKELIFALSPTIEGDTTNFYIFKQISPYKIKTSAISRGISIGGELEYTDEVTLGRSILNRIPFEGTLKSF